MSGGSHLSAITLSEAITCTQKILNYVSYEVVHGTNSEFSDLRTAEQPILQLAKLSVDPFQEGSFIIPASLSEAAVEIAGVQYFAVQVLDKFVEAMTHIADPDIRLPSGLCRRLKI